jgi:ABC-type transport system substrate-binding protein
VVDPYTFRVRLRPHAEFLDIWYQTPIMPRHILGDVPPEQLMQHPFGTSSPVGNGPFRFVRRVPGQEWVFEANPDFPEALGGRPYLDRIVYRNIPEMTTLLTELLTGRIDVYIGPNPNQADQIRNGPGCGWSTSRPAVGVPGVQHAPPAVPGRAGAPRDRDGDQPPADRRRAALRLGDVGAAR